jgi:hypothetical protein
MTGEGFILTHALRFLGVCLVSLFNEKCTRLGALSRDPRKTTSVTK